MENPAGVQSAITAFNREDETTGKGTGTQESERGSERQILTKEKIKKSIASEFRIFRTEG